MREGALRVLAALAWGRAPAALGELRPPRYRCLGCFGLALGPPFGAYIVGQGQCLWGPCAFTAGQRVCWPSLRRPGRQSALVVPAGLQARRGPAQAKLGLTGPECHLQVSRTSTDLTPPAALIRTVCCE